MVSTLIKKKFQTLGSRLQNPFSGTKARNHGLCLSHTTDPFYVLSISTVLVTTPTQRQTHVSPEQRHRLQLSGGKISFCSSIGARLSTTDHFFRKISCSILHLMDASFVLSNIIVCYQRVRQSVRPLVRIAQKYFGSRRISLPYMQRLLRNVFEDNQLP